VSFAGLTMRGDLEMSAGTFGFAVGMFPGKDRCQGVDRADHGNRYRSRSKPRVTGSTPDDQQETDRYWNAIVGNGGQESACGWCKDKWGVSWQITPLVDGAHRAVGKGLCVEPGGSLGVFIVPEAYRVLCHCISSCCGWSPKPSGELTMPRTLTMRLTR
jgi:3-demethylubiquinone-9 3-methyltransferase